MTAAAPTPIRREAVLRPAVSGLLDVSSHQLAAGGRVFPAAAFWAAR